MNARHRPRHKIIVVLLKYDEYKEIPTTGQGDEACIRAAGGKKKRLAIHRTGDHSAATELGKPTRPGMLKTDSLRGLTRGCRREPRNVAEANALRPLRGHTVDVGKVPSPGSNCTAISSSLVRNRCGR